MKKATVAWVFVWLVFGLASSFGMGRVHFTEWGEFAHEIALAGEEVPDVSWDRIDFTFKNGKAVEKIVAELNKRSPSQGDDAFNVWIGGEPPEAWLRYITASTANASRAARFVTTEAPHCGKLLMAYVGAAPTNAPLPPVVTNVPPVISVPWREKITRQMLFVGAPDYFWPTLSAAERTRRLDAVAASGVTGIDVELGGTEGAINYIKGQNPKPNYDARERDLFPAFEPWLKGCRDRGLVISLKFWNCNGDASGRSAAWWKQHAKNFVARFGSDNLLVLVGNERDVATSDDRRKAMYQGFVEAGFPVSQLIGYDSRNEYGIVCGYSESHPQKSDMSDLKGSDFRHINAGDSPQALSYRYESWKKLDGIGGKPRLSNIANVVTRSKARKTSHSEYDFRQIADYESLAVSAKAWGLSSSPSVPPVVAPPATGADAIDISRAVLLGPHKGKKAPQAPITKRLFSSTLSADALKFSYEATNWPSNNSGIGDNIDGRVYVFWMDGGQLVGGHYDWKRPGQTSKDLKNIREGYLDGRKPPAGATIWVCLVNNAVTERTNVVKAEGVWR